MGIGNYAKHARFWDWGKFHWDRTPDDEYWYHYANQYGNSVLIPMCALGEAGAYMARHGMNVTAFDITPEMIAEGKKRFGDVPGLRLYEGDVTDFCFDIPPADFCYSGDFGHILTMDAVKKAFVCINNHLRDGGGLVIETALPPTESHSYPLQTFMPSKQPYPGLKVWKTGEGRVDADTGRHYISQIFYAEAENGQTECFDHSFYLQRYSREEWLAAFAECEFEVKDEYRNREKEPWRKDDRLWIVETVKKDAPMGRG
jgi:SAM-dependent methyltransferase